MPSPLYAVAAQLRRPQLSIETLALAVSAFTTAALNGPFWTAALAGRPAWAASSWRFAIGTFIMLTALQFVLVAAVATRRTVRPLLSALLLVGALAAHFMQRYGIVIDPSMVRNALRTDAREAAELLGPSLLAALVAGLLPAALVWGVRVRSRPGRRVLAVRAGAIVVAITVGAVALLVVFQDFGSLMRNQRALRYAITPANVVYSLGRALVGDAQAARAARAAPDPAQRRLSGARRRPTLLVMVVGETVRSANFGLAGYARNTTPELARRDVVTFGRTTACGTSTEVSLPCMFSPFGRADYDEAKIRSHDSLLHVLARAGLQVVWRDNQSGCKGVCDGLETQDLSMLQVPGLCADGRCHDEILLHELDALVRDHPGDLVVVMHQLGNHGPAYARRYPPRFARFAPACDTPELRDCGREAIVNAYDNAVAYTDHVLARVIDFLEAQRARYDVAMVYVSDHGESLGEHGLYLHGMPRAIAPREQLEVPMLWWLPAESARDLGVNMMCLRQRAEQPASHDHLYHSVLGLLEIDTPRYRSERDLFGDCRTGGPAGEVP